MSILKLKLNMKFRTEPKEILGFSVYTADKDALDALAKAKGVSTSVMMRSLMNSLIDGEIDIDVTGGK